MSDGPRTIAEITLEAFGEWLAAEDLVLAKYGELYNVRMPCPSCCRSTEGHRPGRAPAGLVLGATGLDVMRLSARDRQVLGLTNVEAAVRKAELMREIPCPECSGEIWVYVQRMRDHVLTPYEMPYEQVIARFLARAEEVRNAAA